MRTVSFSGKSDHYLTTTLENNGFFPDLVLGDLQRMYRVPAEYDQAKVEHLLRLAMIDVNDSLAEQQDTWQRAGLSTLAEVPAPIIGGKHALLVQYQRAVFALVTAMAFRQFATVTRREVGEHQAKESPQTEQLYRAESDQALRRLRGITTNITAELL